MPRPFSDIASSALAAAASLSIGVILMGGVLRAAEGDSFPKLYNTQNESIPLLKPEDAVKGIHLPAGFRATLFAGEPDVQQPIGITTDARGRLWVVENYTYAERARNFDTNLNDRVVILEDTDHDGHFDKRTIFWDQAKELTSVAPGFGGVYALCPPRLLFIPDRNGDDVPDGEPQVLLDGFDASAVRHNIANGLKWGPDGWLYGRHGIMATSRVGAPGAAPEQRIAFNAATWRFHPVTHRFEVVAQGTTNPWGDDWDDYGEHFFINTVIGHLWHIIPGAYYKRMYGEHANPHLYELIDQTADHFHWDTHETWSDIRKLGVTSTTSQAGGGHAHSGLMFYLGDNWPEEYRNSIFTVNYHGKRLNRDRIERQGATYVGLHAPDFMLVDDQWFRGIDLLSGPDGGVYVADWSDIGECHDEDGIHRTSGRVYKITYGDPTNHWAGNIAALGNEELVKLQLHHNDWFVRQARLVLQERAVKGGDMKTVQNSLRRMFDEQTEVTRKLRALWALYVTGGAGEEWLRGLLQAENEHVRSWAVQLLVDQGAPSAATLAAFEQSAKTDKSGLVLTYIASAMQRVPLEQRWRIARGLASRTEFAQDRVFPLMIWYGIEPAVTKFTSEAVELAGETVMDKVRRFIARRVFEDLASNPDAANQVVKLLAGKREAGFQFEILTGINEALAGVRNSSPPSAWKEVAPSLEQSTDAGVQGMTRELQALFGDGRAMDSLRAVAANTKTDIALRRRALQTLLQSRATGLSPLLAAMLEEGEIAPDAVRGLAALGGADTATLLLQRYPALKSGAARSEVINTLVSRPTYANALLDAVRRGAPSRQEINASQIRQLRAFNDTEINRKVNAIWPQLDDSTAGKKELFARYKTLLTPERLQAAKPAEGRRIFQQTCGVCHTLFGEGARIGPELTGSDRRNLDYLLDNILDPSGVVPESYRASVVAMKDDRLLSGIVVARADRSITLQTVSEKMVLQRDEIQSIKESQLSMMPDGLLETFTDQQTVDLISYLMSSGPSAAPAADASK